MFGRRKELTPLEMLHKELKWLHSRTSSTFERDEMFKCINRIHSTLIDLVIKDFQSETQKKIKDLQDSVADLYLLGKSDENDKT